MSKIVNYTRFLNTADIHIHEFVRNNKDNFRLEQFIGLAHRMVEIGKQTDTKALLIDGDFVEYAVHNPLVAHYTSQFLQIICDGFEYVGYVLGNHDINSKQDNEHFENSVIPLLFPEGKGEYLHEKVFTLKNGKTIAFSNWVPEQKWEFFEGQVDVMIGHMCISNQFGQEYDPTRYKLGIFGDIHHALEYDNGRTWTVNVPIPNKLGDEQNGSVLLLDTDKMSCERILTESENFKYMKMFYEDSVPEEDKDNPYLFTVKRASKEVEGAKMHFNVKAELNLESVIENVVLAGGFTKIHQEVKTNFLNEADCTPLDFQFNLKKIAVENFRSIGSFEYEFQDGLLWINGEIGSGKSSLLKALNYVLTNNEEPRDCLKEGEKSLRVDLELEYQGRLHRIERKWSGGQSLNYWIDGVPVHGSSIKDRSHMLNQNLPWISRFNLLYRSQMSPGLLSQFSFNDRINLISDILGLNTISAYLDAAKRYMDDKFRELKVHQNEIEIHERVLQSHENFDAEKLAELQQIDFEAAKSDLQSQKSELKSKLQAIQNKKYLVREVQTVESSIGEAPTCEISESEFKEAEQRIQEGEEVKSLISMDIEAIKTEISTAKSDLSNADKQIAVVKSGLSSLKDNCPTCGHDLDIESNNKIRQNSEAQINELAEAKSHIQSFISEKEAELNKTNKDYEEAVALSETFRQKFFKYRDFTKQVEIHNKQVEKLNQLKSNLDADLTDLSEESNLESSLAEVDSNLNMLSRMEGEYDQLRKVENAIKESKEKIESSKKIISELEIEANLSRKYYSIFTNTGEVTSLIFKSVAEIMSDDQLQVTTVRQLASGETRIDFDVEFKVDNIWMKYNKLSGGQMGLADLFFLSKLLKMSNGAGLLILDESLAHISATMLDVAIEEIQTVPANLVIFVTHVASFPHYNFKIDAYREANTTRYVVN